MSTQIKTIDFLRMRYYAIPFSLALVVLSIYMWIQRGETKYGIDFVGGSEILIKTPQASSAEEIGKLLSEGGIKEPIVQSFEGGNEVFSVRIGTINGENIQTVTKDVESALKPKFPDGVQTLKTDTVGATISDEVKRDALLAVAISVAGLLAYIGFRFEFAFGLGAVVAVFHDVIISTGVYLLLGHYLNGAAVAAALTILGYSVNDTIVVFDRIREEMRKRKSYSLPDLMNESITFCLHRTLITSGLTLMAALALYLFGGGAIHDLSLYLVAGIIFGTYSTVYIASPVVLAWERFRTARKAPIKAS